jgi:hypothetical protein
MLALMPSGNMPSQQQAVPVPGPKWVFGKFFLVICLLSGCYGIVANYHFAFKPPHPGDIDMMDEVGQMIALGAIALSGPVLVLTSRHRRGRQYSAMAVYELAQFFLVAVLSGIWAYRRVRDGTDPTTLRLPAYLYWLQFGLSVVEMIGAVVALGMPDRQPAPATPNADGEMRS